MFRMHKLCRRLCETLVAVLAPMPGPVPVHVPRLCYALRILSSSSSTSKGTLDDEDAYDGSEKPKKNLVVRGSFEDTTLKNRQTYIDMVSIFESKDVRRRNHVEFIYAALRNMEEFGVQRDLEVYKKLADVLPKGKFIPTNIFQSEFMHYPKQQQCIIDLLEQMEDNGVMPDTEMENILINVFGRKGHPLRKFWRMMYWMPKFKNLSPWPLPNPVPNETLELAHLAVERMCSVDVRSHVDHWEADEVEDAIDKTWIISGQSCEQSALLERHDHNNPIKIEGPFVIWLRDKTVQYFTLCGDPVPQPVEDDSVADDPDDVSHLLIPKIGEGRSKKQVANPRSVHEQDDGTVFAVCVTGSSTKDSLLSWIRLLEKHGNPALATIPVVFKLRSIVSNEIVSVNEEKSTLNKSPGVSKSE